MEYVFGTAQVGGVEREILKTVGEAPTLAEGEYFSVVREYDDCTISDFCRIEARYNEVTGIDGTKYSFYTITDHRRDINRTKAAQRQIDDLNSKDLDNKMALAEVYELMLGGAAIG